MNPQTSPLVLGEPPGARPSAPPQEHTEKSPFQKILQEASIDLRSLVEMHARTLLETGIIHDECVFWEGMDHCSASLIENDLKTWVRVYYPSKKDEDDETKKLRGRLWKEISQLAMAVSCAG